jgi:hypothetical protein
MNAKKHEQSGGPAFPADVMEDGDFVLPPGQGGATMKKLPGMTLRDYFAARAMQAIFSNLSGVQWPEDSFLNLADHAYMLADAMIKARSKDQQ